MDKDRRRSFAYLVTTSAAAGLLAAVMWTNVIPHPMVDLVCRWAMWISLIALIPLWIAFLVGAK